MSSIVSQCGIPRSGPDIALRIFERDQIIGSQGMASQSKGGNLTVIMIMLKNAAMGVSQRNRRQPAAAGMQGDSATGWRGNRSRRLKHRKTHLRHRVIS
jgi:hypothetical protein